MIRLIFSDMDGTLLDENGRLPEEFGDLYARLKERGIRFAPASGRQYASLRRTFAPWKDELIFVAENGTMVMEGGREIFSSGIERTLVLDALRTGMELPGVQMVMCGKKSGYILSRDNVPAFRHELDQYVTVSSVVEDFAGVEDVLIKIACRSHYRVRSGSISLTSVSARGRPSRRFSGSSVLRPRSVRRSATTTTTLS